MTTKLNEIHTSLKNFIDLGKSNSSTSLPANIQTSVKEVKVELLENGKEKFKEESLKYFAAAENGYIKLTKTEKNKIFKIIEDNYEIKFNKAIQILQKTREDIEKFKEFNIEEFNSLKIINDRRGNSESISTEEIDSIFKDKLEKSTKFNEHKNLILNVQNFPYASMGRLYKKLFEENKWKQIILDINEIFDFIEENKEKLQKATTPLQDLIEKLISKKKVNIVDFYSDENVNKYLSEVSLDDIKNELKDFKDKEIEI
jgi:hypothetical protein